MYSVLTCVCHVYVCLLQNKQADAMKKLGYEDGKLACTFRVYNPCVNRAYYAPRSIVPLRLFLVVAQ